MFCILTKVHSNLKNRFESFAFDNIVNKLNFVSSKEPNELNDLEILQRHKSTDIKPWERLAYRRELTKNDQISKTT